MSLRSIFKNIRPQLSSKNFLQASKMSHDKFLEYRLNLWVKSAYTHISLDLFFRYTIVEAHSLLLTLDKTLFSLYCSSFIYFNDAKGKFHFFFFLKISGIFSFSLNFAFILMLLTQPPESTFENLIFNSFFKLST